TMQYELIILCHYKSVIFQSFLSSITLIQASTVFFFFKDTATTEIYTLSLHDALPIWRTRGQGFGAEVKRRMILGTYALSAEDHPDRKSTRLNSSHVAISYAVFCLKKKIK